MVRAAALALGLALAGCDDMPQARTEGEIHGIASDVAVGRAEEAVSPLRGRVDELETKASEMEAEIASLRSELDVMQAKVGSIEAETDLLQSGAHEHY